MSKELGAPFGREQIYTLVQSGTTSTKHKRAKAEITVNGKGTEIKSDEVLQRRTKKKTITQKVMLSLIDVSKKKGNPEREQAYWNTFHCQSRIFSSNGKLYGNYCKNRFCTVCCGIRKAELINKYLPIIKTWSEPHFTTLTIKAIPAHRLKYVIDGMIRGFKKVKNKLRKRHQRGTGIKLYGIKSFECNFNPVTRTYNPHFHFIFPNKETAELFTKEWLLLLGKKWGHKDAQYSRKVESTERDIIETIKYGSKIFTDPEGKEKVNRKVLKKVPRYIYVSALDNILWALKGHRIFERFGFDLPKGQKKETQSERITNYEAWNFDPHFGDWISEDSEELLSGYSLPPELKNLLAYNVNLELE